MNQVLKTVLQINRDLKSVLKNSSTHLVNVRNYAVRKRFYRNTGILCNDGKYEVTLDQRKLKTPNGNPFYVDSEPLALAVAAEWNAQKDTIQQGTMHLTALCSTALDNPNNVTKYDMVQYIANYLNSDTVLCQSEKEDLYEFQTKEWDPIIEWFNFKFNVNVEKSTNILGPNISSETTTTITRHLLSYNFTAINGFMYATDTLKSLILTLACTERFITPERAVLLSRLEEEFQLNHWKRIEWSHDLSQQDLQARLSAAVLFIYFNSCSEFIKSKKSKLA